MDDKIDLQRFAIDQPQSEAYQLLVSQCQKELATDGMFNLSGFLRPELALGTADQLKEKFDTEAFHHTRKHNIYFQAKLDALPADHPARKMVQTSNRTLCTDQAQDTVLPELYEYPPFQKFLADVMKKPALYVMDDPIAGVNVMRYGDGEALNWHFDRSEFTITILLQKPDAGGAFEYRQDLRTETDPNYDGVARLMHGQDTEVRQIDQSPGTLNVFLGKNTAHRVTPVVGDTPRVIAVLCYYERPGVSFTEEERIGFYGRAG